MRFCSAVFALALVFGSAQCGYAGILTPKVTFSGEAMFRDQGSSQSWYTDGQNAVAYYHDSGIQNDWYTFMQVALPAISGTILSATLNIDVTSGYWN